MLNHMQAADILDKLQDAELASVGFCGTARPLPIKRPDVSHFFDQGSLEGEVADTARRLACHVRCAETGWLPAL